MNENMQQRIAANHDENADTNTKGRFIDNDNNKIDRRRDRSEPPIVVSSSEPLHESENDLINGAHNNEPIAPTSNATCTARIINPFADRFSTEALEAAFHDANSSALPCAIDTAGIYMGNPHFAQIQDNGRQGNNIHQGMPPAMMPGTILPYQAQLFQASPVAYLSHPPRARAGEQPPFQTNAPQFPATVQNMEQITMAQQGIPQMMPQILMILAPVQPQLQAQQLQPFTQQQYAGLSIPSWPSTSSASTSSSHPCPSFTTTARGPPPRPVPVEVRNTVHGSNGINFATVHATPLRPAPKRNKRHASDDTNAISSTSLSHQRASSIAPRPVPCEPDAQQRKRPAEAHGNVVSHKITGAKRRVHAEIPAGDSESPCPQSREKDKCSKDKVKGSAKKKPKRMIQSTCVPLIMPNDMEWLTKKECFLRRHCFELFTANDDDVIASASGRRNPVSLGQVGIRCVFCSKDPANMRAQRAMCFPSSVRTLQKAFVNLVHLHFPACTRIPANVRATYDALKSTHSPMGSNEYRIESMEMVLDDVESGGVRFKANISKDNLPSAPGKIVFGCDKQFMTGSVFLLFEQMQQCYFSTRDQPLHGSAHKLGYNGLACKHCNKAGVMNGRFFPTSPSALASLHDAGEFSAHILKCPNSPQDVIDKLRSTKEKEEDEQQKELDESLKKEFFQRVWLRIHKSFNGKVHSSDKCSDDEIINFKC